MAVPLCGDDLVSNISMPCSHIGHRETGPRRARASCDVSDSWFRAFHSHIGHICTLHPHEPGQRDIYHMIHVLYVYAGKI